MHHLFALWLSFCRLLSAGKGQRLPGCDRSPPKFKFCTVTALVSVFIFMLLCGFGGSFLCAVIKWGVKIIYKKHQSVSTGWVRLSCFFLVSNNPNLKLLALQWKVTFKAFSCLLYWSSIILLHFLLIVSIFYCHHRSKWDEINPSEVPTRV